MSTHSEESTDSELIEEAERHGDLICLTTRVAVENKGSRRVNIPKKEFLDAFDVPAGEDFDVVIRGYSDGRIEIQLPDHF
jgi:hypothetical protein